MFRRIRYYLKRLREAGFRASLIKAKQKIWPLVYWPAYRLGRLPRVTQAERQSLVLFGAICADAFREARRNDPARQVRVQSRLALAESADFQVLGYGDLPKPHSSSWHLDSKHGHAWAVRYFPFCDFIAAETRSDVKVPWELSRLQWLVWLAEASIGADEVERERLKSAFLKTLDDWANANPAGYGVNWACGMEVAIRGTNVAVAAGVFSGLLDSAELDKICSILRAHQIYLSRFPETSDVPGNHYLADVMGEVVLHAALDGLGSPATEKALACFAEVADAQFEPGGCHIERAPIYHRLAFDMVALPYALALRSKSAAAGRLAKISERAAAFMSQLAGDHGRLPVFGDQDSGFVLWFGERAQEVDRRQCRAAHAPSTDLYGFLEPLAGESMLFPDVGREAGTRSGFGTLVSGEVKVTMKTGPIGLEGRAAHDHDDALSVCASWGCRDLIIDPGCHSYTLDPAIRTNTLVSSRHNAPHPAGRERSELVQGSISDSVRGAPTATLTSHTADILIGRLDRTPASRMAITRKVRVERGALEIEDRWEFDAPEGARLFWLFDPAWSIVGPEDAEIPAAGLILKLIAGSATLTATLHAEGARLRRRAEVYSPDYGADAGCPGLEILIPSSRTNTARLVIAG